MPLQFTSTAHAQIVVDTSAPKSQQATLLNTASGLPQVNITAPSAGGVSRNTFTQFDIQSQGAILNNSRTNVQTQLGGFVQGNAALAGGSARIILNEVNSANATQLRGFLEVAGQRAEVIIANPSGINVDGGGFINATRATLTTGTPVINSGNLDGFLVQKGVIRINGAGLDSTQTDFTGLMARAVEVNAGIWAKELKVTAGANQVNADQSLAVAAPAQATGPAPAFAIDTSLLGGMYAGKISLVGTEAGLGVRNAGTLAATGASAGNVAISVDGMLTNAATARISSSADISLSAKTLTNDGQIAAGGLAGVTTTQTLTNNSLIKGTQVQLQADTLNNTAAGRVEGTTVSANAQGFNNAGQFNATGQLSVAATATLVNQGKLAGQQTTAQAATLDNQGTGRIEGDTIAITAGTATNTGSITGNNVTLTATNLNNQGSTALIAGTTGVNLYVGNALNNTGGATVYSLGDLNIAANASRDADGTLLNRTTLVNNDSSLLQGDNDVQVAAQNFNNVRPAPVITNTSTSTTKTLTKASGYVMCEYGNYIDNFAGYCADHYANLSWYNPDIHINPYAEKPGMFIGGWMVEGERYTTTTVTKDAMSGTLAPEPKVLAGRNLILKNVGNLRNDYGSLTAGQDVTIGNTDPLGAWQTASVTNIGGLLNQNTVVDEYSVFHWNRNYGSATSQSVAPTSSNVVLGRIGGTMSAGGSFTVNATTVTNTNALPGQSSVTGPASPGPAGAAFAIPVLTTLVIPAPTNPTRGYLIESDPRFANYRNWLSSDYLLAALGTDPTLMQKRLGDGFYEQKLIREQVGQLTGRRFLDGYANDEAQYQALMVSGVTVAQQWNLRPGVALTAAQVSQLTSDIVWLVEQTVAVSDTNGPPGATVQVKAWVPVVYLSQIHTADLHPTGALISGQSVSIAARGDLTNNGALQARDSILLAAGKVSNEIGLIDASRGTTTVRSDTDILNRSGLISGNSVQLDAARDIQLDAVTRQITATRQTASGQVSGSNTEVGPQGSVISRGDLAINAGRDIRLAGALVSAQGNASLNAGASLVVDTVQTQQSTQDVSGMGVRRTQGTTNLASTVQTGGSLSLTSGGDTTLRAAQVGAGQDVSIVSGGNLTILNATNTTQLDEALRAKGYVRNDHTAQERVVGSNIVAGGNVTLAALQTAPDGSKGNITVQGSSINAVTGQLNVVAANNVNIIEAREKGEYDLFNETKGSKTFSSKTQTAHDTGSSDIAVGSSLSGKTVNIDAGRNLTVRGSSVVSDDQTRLAASNNISIEAAQNFETSTTFREEKKSGLFSSGAGLTLGKKQQSTDQQDTRTTASASTVGSIAGNVTISAGEAFKQVGSDVIAPAGDITIVAKSVDITEARETSRSAFEQKFSQSGLSAGLSSTVVSAVQEARGQISAMGQTGDDRVKALAGAAAAGKLAQAAQAIDNGQYSSVDPATGKLFTPNAADKAGGISLNISLGSSKSQSNSSVISDSARGSTVAAGGNVTIQATGAGQASDLTIQGSSVDAGKNVNLQADGDIALLAARNTGSNTNSNSASSASIGASLGLGSAGGLSFNASVNKSAGQGNGADESFTNTQVRAANTVSLTSGADTTLKGAVVTANQIKADVGGKLAIESLQDSSTYQESNKSSGASLSISVTGIPTGGALSSGKSNINSNFQSVAEQSGLKAGDGGFQVSVAGNTDLKGGAITSTQKAIDDGKNSFSTGGSLTTSDIQNTANYNATGSGFTIGVSSELGKSGMGIGSKSGDAGSTTQAAISGVAGNKDARTGDAEAGIKPIFDRDAVRNDVNAQVAITTAFGQQGAQAIGNYAQTRLEEALKNKDQPAIDDWKEGGPARVALHAALGALTGNLGGALGAAGSQSVLPWLGEQIDQLGVPAEVKQALLQAAGVAVGSALGGAGGASSALNATAQNYLRHEEALLRAQLSSKLQSCQGNDCILIREQIELINKTDIWRDQQIEQACKNPSSADCGAWNKDLQTALASYNDRDLTALGLRNAAGKASSLADLYQNRINNPVAYGVATSLLKNAISTVTGIGQLSYTLTSAALGDAQAQQDLRQTVTAIRDTVSDPSGAIVAQLEAADRADAAGNPAEAARIRTDLVLVVGGTTAGASTLGKSANNLWKAANSLDNVLGDVKPSSNGFISTRQLTEEGMPARLSNAELAELNKMPQAANTTAKGNIGESVMDSYFSRNGYKPLDGKCGAQCFDGVYLKDGKVYINEVKPMGADGSIQLSGPNQTSGLPTQMSDSWIKDRANYLVNNGTPEQIRTGQTILDAIKNEKLVSVVTGVNPSGATMVKLSPVKKP